MGKLFDGIAENEHTIEHRIKISDRNNPEKRFDSIEISE